MRYPGLRLLLPAVLVCLVLCHVRCESIPEPLESRVEVLDHANFEKYIQSNPYVLVEFYAPWCAVCRSLTEVYREAAEELYRVMMRARYMEATGRSKSVMPKIKFAKVDATLPSNFELKAKYNLRGYPSIKLFSQGDLDRPIDYKGPRTAQGFVLQVQHMVKEKQTAEMVERLKDRARETGLLPRGSYYDREHILHVNARNFSSAFENNDRNLLAILFHNEESIQSRRFLPTFVEASHLLYHRRVDRASHCRRAAAAVGPELSANLDSSIQSTASINYNSSSGDTNSGSGSYSDRNTNTALSHGGFVRCATGADPATGNGKDFSLTHVPIQFALVELTRLPPPSPIEQEKQQQGLIGGGGNEEGGAVVAAVGGGHGSSYGAHDGHSSGSAGDNGKSSTAAGGGGGGAGGGHYSFAFENDKLLQHHIVRQYPSIVVYAIGEGPPQDWAPSRLKAKAMRRRVHRSRNSARNSNIHSNKDNNNNSHDKSRIDAGDKGDRLEYKSGSGGIGSGGSGSGGGGGGGGRGHKYRGSLDLVGFSEALAGMACGVSTTTGSKTHSTANSNTGSTDTDEAGTGGPTVYDMYDGEFYDEPPQSSVVRIRGGVAELETVVKQIRYGAVTLAVTATATVGSTVGSTVESSEQFTGDGDKAVPDKVSHRKRLSGGTTTSSRGSNNSPQATGEDNGSNNQQQGGGGGGGVLIVHAYTHWCGALPPGGISTAGAGAGAGAGDRGLDNSPSSNERGKAASRPPIDKSSIASSGSSGVRQALFSVLWRLKTALRALQDKTGLILGHIFRLHRGGLATSGGVARITRVSDFCPISARPPHLDRGERQRVEDGGYLAYIAATTGAVGTGRGLWRQYKRIQSQGRCLATAKMLSKLSAKLGREYKGRVRIYKVDLEENEDSMKLGTHLHIQDVPALSIVHIRPQPSNKEGGDGDSGNSNTGRAEDGFGNAVLSADHEVYRYNGAWTEKDLIRTVEELMNKAQ